MATHPSDPIRPSYGGLVLGIAVIVLVGIPLTALVWETLNELLAGRVEPAHLARGIVALGLLLVLWWFMGRLVQRWDRRTAPGRSA